MSWTKVHRHEMRMLMWSPIRSVPITKAVKWKFDFTQCVILPFASTIVSFSWTPYTVYFIDSKTNQLNIKRLRSVEYVWTKETKRDDRFLFAKNKISWKWRDVWSWWILNVFFRLIFTVNRRFFLNQYLEWDTILKDNHKMLEEHFLIIELNVINKLWTRNT